MERINDSNYELWLVRYADGELTAAERKGVESWLEAHPEAAEELAIYREAPRLERDEYIRYTTAVQPHTRSIWSKGWTWTAAAAVVLLLLSPLALRLFSGPAEPMQVAQATPPVETRRAASAIPTTQHDDIIADAQPTPSVETRRAASAILTTQHDDIVETRRAASAIPTTPNNEIIADAARRVSTNSPNDDIIADAQPTPSVETRRAASAIPTTLNNEIIADAARRVSTNSPDDDIIADAARRVSTDAPIADSNILADAQPATAESVITEEDTLDYLEQRLLALADGTREGLQSTYLGRRLSRRLPENDELLTRVDEARERTPRGIRVVTDLVVKLIEVNSKEKNQQNSITL